MPLRLIMAIFEVSVNGLLFEDGLNGSQQIGIPVLEPGAVG